MYNAFDGIFSIPFILTFTFIGWCFWELIFWIVSFIHITISI